MSEKRLNNSSKAEPRSESESANRRETTDCNSDEKLDTSAMSAFNRRRFMQVAGASVFGTALSTGFASGHTNEYSGEEVRSGDTTSKSPDELVGEMTLDEKVTLVHGHQAEEGYGYQMPGTSVSFAVIPPIPRLDVPALEPTNGGAGVSQGGANTAFPAPLAQAASWNTELLREIGEVLGIESKARNRELIHAPAFNQFRVPECGRNFEYAGEDPYLRSRAAVELTEGIQSAGVIANAKHYACNNQETVRQIANAIVDERTLREIYLPPFKSAVKEADVGSVMSAYNRVNGTYCNENGRLLTYILKDEWGFDGVTLPDYLSTSVSTAEAAEHANAGLDLELPLGDKYDDDLRQAVENGDVSIERLNDMARRILRMSKEIGKLDGDRVGPDGETNTDAHQLLSRNSAIEGGVLLKNNRPGLPLDLDTIDSIGVIGHEADQAKAGGQSSAGTTPPYKVSPLEGIRDRVGDQATVEFTDGQVIADAVVLAESVDVAIVFVQNSSGSQKDREDIRLDNSQNELMSSVADANPHTVGVVNTGDPIVMPWKDKVPSILQMWYPGMEDGNATASLLFGDANPSGKLPVTFAEKRDDYAVTSPEQYPGTEATIDGESVQNAKYSEGIYVGYRHFDKNNIRPMFPFGHGLSYTDFEYDNLEVSPSQVNLENNSVKAKVDVTNVGDRAGKEVIQVYVHDHFASVDRPVKELAEFEKVHLEAGETKTVEFTLDTDALAFYDVYEEDWVAEAGRYTLLVGRSSRDIRLLESFEATEGTRTSDRDPEQKPQIPHVDGTRNDDGSVFTGGQTNQIDLTIEATAAVRVRDQVPSDWSVVAGDDHEVYTEDGTKYIEFDKPVKSGTRTYFAEAPSGLDSTDTYTFDPIQYKFGEKNWRMLHGTAEDNTVVGADTDV